MEYRGTITGGSALNLWMVECPDAPPPLQTMFLRTPAFPVAIGLRVVVRYTSDRSYGMWNIVEVLP